MCCELSSGRPPSASALCPILIRPLPPTRHQSSGPESGGRAAARQPRDVPRDAPRRPAKWSGAPRGPRPSHGAASSAPPRPGPRGSLVTLVTARPGRHRRPRRRDRGLVFYSEIGFGSRSPRPGGLGCFTSSLSGGITVLRGAMRCNSISHIVDPSPAQNSHDDMSRKVLVTGAQSVSQVVYYRAGELSGVRPQWGLAWAWRTIEARGQPGATPLTPSLLRPSAPSDLLQSSTAVYSPHPVGKCSLLYVPLVLY